MSLENTETVSDPSDTDNSPDIDRPDRLSMAQLVLGFLFALIIGFIVNFISRGRISIVLAIAGGIVCFIVAGSLFYILRAILRYLAGL